MRKRSIISNSDYCIMCGRLKEAEHHLIFGMSYRTLADKDGCYIPICNTCHNLGNKDSSIHGNSAAEKLSKIAGQLAVEKSYVENGLTGVEAHKKFMERYGRSFY